MKVIRGNDIESKTRGEGRAHEGEVSGSRKYKVQIETAKPAEQQQPAAPRQEAEAPREAPATRQRVLSGEEVTPAAQTQVESQPTQEPQPQQSETLDTRVPPGLTTIRADDSGLVDVSGLGVMAPQTTTRANSAPLEAGASFYEMEQQAPRQQGEEPPATPEPNSTVASEALMGGEVQPQPMRQASNAETEPEAPEPKGEPNGKRPSRGKAINEPYRGDQQAVTDNRMPSLINRLTGWKNRDRSPKFMQPSMKRPGKLKKRLQDRAKERFSRSGIGYHVYGKIIGNTTLDFEEVGVGCQDIMAAIRQNPQMIDALFTKWNNGEPVGVDETWSLNRVQKWVDEHPIWVATFKSPDNRGPDIQGRRLRVMNEARGVYLHPTVIAMYTADTDGDDMCVSFNPSTYFNTWDPMEHLIGIDGEQTLDTKFLPLAKILPTDGKTPAEFVHMVMIADVLRKNGWKLEGKESFIKSVVALGDSIEKSGDDQAKAWGDMFREARKVSLLNKKGRRSQNLLMAELVKAVYDGMHQIALEGYFMNAPSYRVEPVTYEDNAIFRVVDGIIDGEVPNNFQDLKLMLTGFVGNVSGQNAPFRFSADVGKMMKLDRRFMIGEEFVVDPNDENAMNEVLNCTLKMAASRTMAKNLEITGRSAYYTQLLRDNVIREVGFYDSTITDANGNLQRRYASFNDFLRAFEWSYNKHSSIINEANVVFLANMGITRQENLVTPLKSDVRKSDGKSVITLDNFAGPFSEVYGSYSVRRMFRELARGHMRQTEYWRDYSKRLSEKRGEEINVDPTQMDPFWRGNPNQVSKSPHNVEREYDNYGKGDMFWVTAKYLEYSLSKFKVENRLLQGDTGLSMKDVRAMTVDDLRGSDDIDNEFYLLLAIADKRTSASSKWNTSTYGKFGGEDADLKKGEKTDLQMMSENLKELRRLDGMSPLLAPGYYAGIGSSGAPQQVLNAMTTLSSRLSNQNWCVRGGHLVGSDQAFELGAGKNSISYIAGAYDGMTPATGTSHMFSELPQEFKDIAMESVKKLHPEADKLDEKKRLLAATSYFQVAGIANRPDSAFVACYVTRDENGIEQGDEAQTIRIARSRGIPVFNAYDYVDVERGDYSGLERWQNDVMDAAAKSMSGQLRRHGVGKEQMYWVNNTIDTLIRSNPDVFCYFGMDSPAGFLQSVWGQMMLEHADDVNVLSGIRSTMVYMYKMDRINALQAELDALDKSDMDRFEKLWNKLSLAKDELSASSETWHGVIREFESEVQGKSVFKYFKKEHREGMIQKRYRVGNVTLAQNQMLDAKQFWISDTEHDSLEDVMNDPMIDARTKFAIVADIVRYWENDVHLQTFEAAYQMEIGSNSTFSMVGSMTSPIKQHREYEESFNKWGRRSREKLQENISRASEMYRGRKGYLLNALTNIDKRPWSFVQISDQVYADSLMSVLDKTYAQTEKASQHPWTNAIYTALGMQRNGGPKHDIYRTDNRLLGVVGVDDVGIEDVIHILANPEEELWVYDEYGGIGYVTRDLLLESVLGREVSADVEADIWEFLETMPHIAAAIRLHSACVMSDSKGGGYVGAMCSTSETIASMQGTVTDPIDHVKYLMRDHPVYGGLIMLAMPTKGVVTRNHRERAVKVEQYVAGRLYELARGDGDSSTLATVLLNDLGITLNSVYSALRSDYDVFLEKSGLPMLEDADPDERDSEAYSDAKTTYTETLHDYVTKYIDEIRDEVDLSGDIFPVTKPSDVRLGVDAASLAAFWDTVQELGGAKTAVSTGVEGWETWQYSMWASHIDMKDTYADLAWVADDITPEWNGAWTSLVDEDSKETIKLQVDEDGNITNQFEYRDPDTKKTRMVDVFEWMKLRGIGSVAVMPPQGYVIQDRSTDSHGTPVPSMFTYMVSKRSNGAEAFNLKAKKAGIDSSDSITKMHGKYRMVEYEDADGNKHLRPANYYDIQYDLQVIAAEKGIVYAKQRLAEMMLRENEDLGYKDMSLANYMSMANVMLIQGDDGLVHLRSLEMLFTAIKGRLAPDIEGMSDQEIRDAANTIVYDTSMETGVGMRAMDPLDAFSQIEPKGAASPSFGRRPKSSVFARNYMLLEEISNNNEGIAERFTTQQLEQIDKHITDRKNGLWDLRKNKSELVRDYNIIGFTASTDFRESMKEELHWVVGPSNAIYVGKDTTAPAERIAQICDRAYDMGMTVIVSAENRDKIPDKYLRDCMPAGDGDVLIPMFDMRLNGSEAAPSSGRFAIFQAPYSRYTQCVEDPINFYQLADAQYKPTRAFTDRVKVVDRRTRLVKADDLFRNVFANPDYRDNSLKVSLASMHDVEQLIAHGVKCTIDYGVAENSREFEQRRHDVDAAIKRYQDRWGKTNADGNLVDGKSECEPGDIVAWAMLEMTDPLTEDVSYVLAPIIPYQLHETKAALAKFVVTQIGYVDRDHTRFSVDMMNTSEIGEGYAKYFDSSGGANKGMINFVDGIETDLRLRDGTAVDMYCAKASTDSRKVGTDRRIKTMISLMAKARMRGYNFANVDGSFPDNPELRERMLHERIPQSEWRKTLKDDGFRFSSDRKLDAFLRWECKKILKDGGNPSDYLANVFTDSEGIEHNTHVMWEFEAMFEQGINYEDSLLHFLHTMHPDFCPDGLEDTSEDHTFRLKKEGEEIAKGYDRGVLEMQVPYEYKGNIVYKWANVYVGMSFFSDDYSGFSRPNVEGASVMLDGMNTMSYYGIQLDQAAVYDRADWATSDYGAIPRDGGAIGVE